MKYKKEILLSLASLAAIAFAFIRYVYIPVDFEDKGGRLIFSRFLVMSAFFQLFIVALVFWRACCKVLKSFFAAKAAPVNLAVFRIAFFYYILQRSLNRILWYSGFPHDLQFPPRGWGRILPHVPINESLVANAAFVFDIACVLALLGLFTRFSTFVVAALGFYLYGIDQFYGKINHFHHLWWFMAVFASSRCADVLSLDALIKGWRKPRDNGGLPIKPSPLYALPLSFVWILMGILYFFPGLWKAYNGGWDWAFSDNLKLYMYKVWNIEQFGWKPPFRIDRYPALCHFSALSVILFELSFIFLMLTPVTRRLAFLGGLTFHKMTNMFMRISFVSLQWCYVALVNWDYIFRKIGQWVFGKKALAVFDQNNTAVLRVLSMVQSLDVLGQIDYVPFQDKDNIPQEALSKCTPAAGLQTFVRGDRKEGCGALLWLMPRLPLLWPLAFFFLVRPAVRVLNRAMDSLPGQAMKKPDVQTTPLLRKAMAYAYVILTGATLVFFNGYAGFYRIHSWPFSCYPTFEWLQEQPVASRMVLVALDADGNKINFDEKAFKKKFGADKFYMMTREALYIKDAVRRRKKFLALIEVWRRFDPAVGKAKKIRFYGENFSTLPEDYAKGPFERYLEFEVDI